MFTLDRLLANDGDIDTHWLLHCYEQTYQQKMGITMKWKAIAVGMMALTLSGCWKTREGSKTGLLVKVAKEGVFWGTYEGELIRGGFDSGSGGNGNAFHFSFGQFRNSNVVKALELMDKNKPVVIKYHCNLFNPPWASATSCFLDEINAHES